MAPGWEQPDYVSRNQQVQDAAAAFPPPHISATAGLQWASFVLEDAANQSYTQPDRSHGTTHQSNPSTAGFQANEAAPALHLGLDMRQRE